MLTSRLVPSKYESWLVAGNEGPDEGDFLSLRGIAMDNLIRLPELGRELRAGQDAVALAKLIRLMRRERPHIVHTHTAKAGTLGRIAARVVGVPVVVHTFHGHVLSGYFGQMRARAFIAVERVLARMTTRLVAVTPAIRQELLDMRIGTPDRFSVIKLGLDLEPFITADRFRSELRTELGVQSSTPLIGIVGRLVPIKDHELFLAAAAQIAAVSDAHFVIVGDGELREVLKARVAALGLSSCVHFLGWRSDLARIYSDLDLVVLTSLNEGSPVALIEAMAAGRPVVATRVGGVADVVSHGTTGLLVPSGDRLALVDAITTLIRDKPRRVAMGAAGKAAAYPAYGAERLLADVDALYSDALARQNVRRDTAD